MARFVSRWRHPDFLKLWFAQTLAALSAFVTTLAVPLIAALTLQASPLEMGLLTTLATLPNLVFGLLAGAWVDRARRRSLMIAADVTRAVLLVSIPAASAANLLSIELLYAVMFVFGIGTTVFEVANVAYLPSLVGRTNVLGANSRLVASTSIAGAVGPGLAGVLIHLLSAPVALLIDAAALLLSATVLRTIRSPEPIPTPAPSGHSRWDTIAEGLRPLLHDPLLRSITGSSMLYLFFNNILVAVYVLYASRILGLTPVALGIVYGMGGIGAAFGAVLATPAARRFGLGYTMIGANLLGGLFLLLVPLAGVLPTAALALVGTAQAGSQLLGAVFFINQTSLRQLITPERLLGRMTASYRFLTMGMMPLGAVVGGVLGSAIGVPATVLVGTLGTLLAAGWLVWSPARQIDARDGHEYELASRSRPERA